MVVYLPIAEMTVNVLLYMGMGAAVGFLSGMFGVGGGFLITPLLMVAGVSPAVAVGTGAAQVVASSFSGTVAQFRRNNVDFKMGFVLFIGGLVGAVVGVQVVRALRSIGQFDFVVAVSYVVFLGTIGGIMLIESIHALRNLSQVPAVNPRRRDRTMIQALPWKMRFPRSKLYISALPPLLIGATVGLLSSIMGVGGGFVMVPALIYLLKMPTNIVIGTSLFQIGCVTAVSTLLHSVNNHNVDIVLATLLMLGAVVGAELGASAGQRLRGEQLRFLLAALVLMVCARMAVDLVVRPDNVYSVSAQLGGV